MENEWSENKIDNSLYNEVIRKDTNLENIKNIISSGANINTISKFGDNLLTEVIRNWEADEGNIKFDVINLLLDLGININHTIEGFNCLFNAWLRYNPNLIELLLQKGANPNCISTDTNQSLLDWIEWDRHFEVDLEKTNDIEWIESMDKIIELLKKYGAKTRKEIQ